LLQQQNYYFYQQNVWLLQQNFWLQQQKKIFVVPNFVAVTKPLFSMYESEKRNFSPVVLFTVFFSK